MDRVFSALYRSFSWQKSRTTKEENSKEANSKDANSKEANSKVENSKEENFGSGTTKVEIKLHDYHCELFRNRNVVQKIDQDLHRLKIHSQWHVDSVAKTLTVRAETSSVAFRYAFIITKLIDWRCSNEYKTDHNKKCLSTLLNSDFFEIDFFNGSTFLSENSTNIPPSIDQLCQDVEAINDFNERAFLRSVEGRRELQKIFRKNNVLIFFKNEFSPDAECILSGEICVNSHRCKIELFAGYLKHQKADWVIDFFEQLENWSLTKWQFLDETEQIAPKTTRPDLGKVIPIIFPEKLSINEHKRVVALQEKLCDALREARKRHNVKTIALSLVDIFRCNIENATAAVVKSILEVLKEGDMPKIRLVDHRSEAILAFENAFKQIPEMQISTPGSENQDCTLPAIENDHIFHLPGGAKICIVLSDIVAAANTVDVVVNSTDTTLANAGCSSKALLQGSGQAVMEELKSKYPRGIDEGDIAITGAGYLKCKNIIHIAVPKWSDYSCLAVLERTMRRCLNAASKLHASSIAFPAIGTGGLKYPVEATSRCMMHFGLDWLQNAQHITPVHTIHFVLRPEDVTVVEAFKNSLVAEYVSVMNEMNVQSSELIENLSLEVGFIGKRANIGNAMREMHTVLDQFLPAETFQDYRLKNLPFDKMKDLYDLARHSKLVMEYERDEGRLNIRGCHVKQFVTHLKTTIGWSIIDWSDNKTDLYSIIPKGWQSKEDQTGYVLVDLQQSMEEYKDVEKAIRQTSVAQVKIEKIQRVENVRLYKSYLIEKEKGIAEKFLFHGTHSKNVASICTQGFNWRLAGTNAGHLFGHGNYFSTSCSFSTQYAKDGQMFFARVLVGESVAGTPDTKIPPLKPGSAVDQYESTVNAIKNPSIYVVYYDSRAYPAYLITFK